MPAKTRARLTPPKNKPHKESFSTGDYVRVRREHGIVKGRIIKFEVVNIFKDHGELPVVAYEDGTIGFVFNDMKMERL